MQTLLLVVLFLFTEAASAQANDGAVVFGGSKKVTESQNDLITEEPDYHGDEDYYYSYDEEDSEGSGDEIDLGTRAIFFSGGGGRGRGRGRGTRRRRPAAQLPPQGNVHASPVDNPTSSVRPHKIGSRKWFS